MTRPTFGACDECGQTGPLQPAEFHDGAIVYAPAGLDMTTGQLIPANVCVPCWASLAADVPDDATLDANALALTLAVLFALSDGGAAPSA